MEMTDWSRVRDWYYRMDHLNTGISVAAWRLLIKRAPSQGSKNSKMFGLGNNSVEELLTYYNEGHRSPGGGGKKTNIYEMCLKTYRPRPVKNQSSFR